MHDTFPSIHVWELKDSNMEYDFTWRIIKRKKRLQSQPTPLQLILNTETLPPMSTCSKKDLNWSAGITTNTNFSRLKSAIPAVTEFFNLTF